MDYQILFIQGAGNVTAAEEQVIADALKANLGDKFSVVLPAIPDADNPTYQTWNSVLTEKLKSLTGKVILFGHSLGGSVILKHFSMEPVPEKVIGMVLFGVPYWKDQNWDVSEYVIEDDFLDNLGKLEHIYLYYSPDDEVIPNSHLKAYEKLLPQAKIRIIQGLDHSYHGAIGNMISDIFDLTTNAGTDQK